MTTERPWNHFRLYDLEVDDFTVPNTPSHIVHQTRNTYK